MSRTTHVIGAGLAGLSAAIALTQAGRRVILHEAGPQAGGRCRSYDDREIGCRIDNGNHLLLSGNRAASWYLETIGAAGTMAGPGAPFFPFMDLADGRRWTLRPSGGRIPWWVLDRNRRVPGTRPGDYFKLLKVARANGTTVMSDILPPGPLGRDLLAPLAVSALNTPTDSGAAGLMAAVMRETLMAGGRACIPLFPRASLAESFIDPALDWLRARGADIQFSRRIAGLAINAGRVTALRHAGADLPLAPDADVVLAVPPWVAAELLPDLRTPDEYQAILNIHIRAEAPDAAPAIRRAGFIGLVGGAAEWVFLKPGHVSATISAANLLVDQPAGAIAALVWPEIARVLNLAGPIPAWRVVKEKRATFAATPAQHSRRPPARTPIDNLVLAGDWTATDLPATIEGAIRSGRSAATVLVAPR